MGRGMGAINCSWLPFGGQGLVEPTCWCLTVGPTICDGVAGKGTYAAALAVNSDPSAPPPPPVVSAPDPSNPNIDSVLAQQWQAWKEQNSAFFASVADSAASNTPSPASIPVWVWIVGGVLGAVVLKGVLR